MYLARSAALRICLPAAGTLPPFVDWPPDLRVVVEGSVHLVRGGYEVDGSPIAPFDADAVRAAGRAFRADGVEAIAVTAAFSPLNPDMEQQAAAILAEECPGARLTLSHELGRIGLLARENVSLLNAALVPMALRTVDAFGEALAAAGISAPLFITQNDGTVVSSQEAAAYPVRSFASGPTNSLRGAAFLSGLDRALVVDVGGTTTDVGSLVNGFPREANNVVHVGGGQFRLDGNAWRGIGRRDIRRRCFLR